MANDSNVTWQDYLLEHQKEKKIWCKALLIVSTVVCVILVGIVALVTVVLVSNQTGDKRYCPVGVLGSIRLNEKGTYIIWYFQTTGTQSINIYTGGSLYLPICGFPSTLACDLSVPGILQGTITELNTVSLSGQPLQPFITNINSEPSLYFLKIDNVTVGNLGVGC